MYTPTIGLEIHAELRTRTKMFCSSLNVPDATEPNIHVCPVCVGHPGVLPTINKEAVKHVLRVGLAMNGELADYTEFDRKNYFYPDIPKAYQLSQYEFPLVSGGSLAGVELTRIHLEEDTARSIHTNDSESSYVDYNRSSVPLMELVTEPVIHTAHDAGAFARELQILLRTLGASDAHMEKGEMRVEANISVAKDGEPLGTKVEVKNLNSFRSVERAIDFEIARHIALLEKGEAVVQETRGWDEDKLVTFSQRLKEEAADYRYFPDPDLPKLKLSEISEFEHDVLHATLPELPDARRARLADEFGLTPENIEVLVSDVRLAQLFDDTVRVHTRDTKYGVLVANYLVNNVRALTLPAGTLHVADVLTPDVFAEIVRLAHEGEVSSNGAVALLEVALTGTLEETNVEAVAREKGLLQENDTAALESLVTAVIAENDTAVAEYKAGKEQALQFLVGQGMKASRGSANPAKLKELFANALT